MDTRCRARFNSRFRANGLRSACALAARGKARPLCIGLACRGPWPARGREHRRSRGSIARPSIGGPSGMCSGHFRRAPSGDRQCATRRIARQHYRCGNAVMDLADAGGEFDRIRARRRPVARGVAFPEDRPCRSVSDCVRGGLCSDRTYASARQPRHRALGRGHACPDRRILDRSANHPLATRHIIGRDCADAIEPLLAS